MSENLKVNAKTNILEFKRKHNKLVDKVENATEEIINKIERNYLEGSHITEITFPKGVIPLRFSLNTHELYIKGNTFLDEQGGISQDYELLGVSVKNEKIVLGIDGNCMEDTLSNLYYLNYSGSNPELVRDSFAFLNTDDLKLFKHTYELSTGDTIEIIDNNSQRAQSLSDIANNHFSRLYTGYASSAAYNSGILVDFDSDTYVFVDYEEGIKSISIQGATFTETMHQL